MIYKCFTAKMIGEFDETQISANLNAEQPEFWAIAIFGNAEILKPFRKNLAYTSKFHQIRF